jgi:NAD(P)-dependent dehydrogenase (short-subunit alcohol dehydrogenase family)
MNIIITGASSGIGYQTVLMFAKDKRHNIIAVSRNKQKLDALLAEAKTINPNCNLKLLEFDISSDNDKNDLFTLANKEFDKIDILINNAGLLINKPFQDLTVSDFESVYKVNVFGVVKTIQSLLPLMGKSHTHIVNIGSIGGVEGSMKFNGLSAYSSSKGALAVLTECMAEEFKEMNISVNYLALGSVKTEMFSEAFPGIKAQVSPKDMAKYVAEFAANGADFMNGKIIQVSKSTP